MGAPGMGAPGMGAPAMGYLPAGRADAAPPLDAKGLLRSLYDFGFTSLIGPRIIKFLYALMVVVYSIVAVIWLLVSFASGSAILILFALIFVPVLYLIYMILLRIFMELIVVFFKMGEDVHGIRHAAGRV